MTNDTLAKERTHNYFRQVKGAALFKAASVGISFLALPLMIHYLGQEQFGIWSTLLTIMSWIVFFDLGVGNSLRNKVAEALARDEQALAIDTIASGYTLIGLIVIVLWILATSISFALPWQTIFNTQAIAEAKLRLAVQIVISFILLNLWIGLINSLLSAVQRQSLQALGQLISNGLLLLSIYLLTRISDHSMLPLAICYGLAITLANLVLSAAFFRRHPQLRPRFYFQRHLVKPLLSAGAQFFTIQIAFLVIFASDKILITQLFGPQSVTPYEVVFKLFSAIMFFHTLLSAPLWSAYTEAYHRGDLLWVRQMLYKQIGIFGAILLAVIAMTLLARPIIHLWVARLEVSPVLIVSMAAYVVITMWGNIFAHFLNGIQKIKISLLLAVIAMFINIPVSILLAKYSALATASVIWGSIVALTPSAFLMPYQTWKILNRQDHGIWAK